MTWLQLSLEPPPDLLEAVEETLFDAGAQAVTLQDAGDEPVLEPAPGEAPLWSQTRLVALFPEGTDIAAVLARLRDGWGPDIVQCATVTSLHDRAWELEWRRDYHPMAFGGRLWVSPPDALASCPADAAVVILEPGLAFGTGTHATTALCLRWLAANPPAGKCVLDYGCGSGILALAAAALGAESVVATDIDPQALQATADNAQRNERTIDLHMPETLPHRTADVVLANILAGTLRDLAPRLAGFCPPGGDLVLSGILNEQAAAVLSAYRPWFDFSPPAVLGDWCLLHGTRKAETRAVHDDSASFLLA